MASIDAHNARSVAGALNQLLPDGHTAGDASGPVRLTEYTVAAAPDAADYEGCLIYVSDGADGSPTLAWSNGTNWIEEDGTAIAGA